MAGSRSCFGVPGDLSQHQEKQQRAWKTLTNSQSTQEGSLLKFNLVKAGGPLMRCDAQSARPEWVLQKACWL